MDTRAILVRQIGERADQLRRRMLWDLTAENVPEQEAWDIEHPPIVTVGLKPTHPGAVPRVRSFNDMSPDDLLKFVEAMGSNAARVRDTAVIAEIFLKELAKRGRL